MQNKIHYAIHGQTAAEVIHTWTVAEKDFMGNQPTLKEAIVGGTKESYGRKVKGN